MPPPGGGYPGYNTAAGQNALFSLTTGVGNAALGGYTLYTETTGNGNTGVGLNALRNSADGNYNTAVGLDAFYAYHGDSSCAFGAFALFANSIGVNNAFGYGALASNTTPGENCAFGNLALNRHATGSYNNAVGDSALESHQSGGRNNAFGANALVSNVSGNDNTAVGDQALALCTGSSNTALGAAAGGLATSGSGNVHIGYGTLGAAGESNHTYIRNINNTTVSGGGTESVIVNLGTGLLGHVGSSRRYKEDIKPMDDASEVIYRLKPVSFRYRKGIDPSESLDYGLLAEDVAEVEPNLASHGKDGQIENVRYSAIDAMLLNEFLKQHSVVQQQGRQIQARKHKIIELRAGIAKDEANMARQRRRFQSALTEQERQIEALTVALRKVRAEIERNRLTPQTVQNQ